MSKPFSTTLVLFVLLAAGGCGSGVSIKPTVKIGLVAPFEGLHRALGYEALYGAKLAVAERNQAGGVAGYLVELVALNDDQDPLLAAQRAREMGIDADVVAVVGHLGEQTTLAALPVYQDLGMALVVPVSAGGASTGEAPAQIFRLAADHRTVGAVAARYAVLERGAKRLAIVGGDKDLTESFTSASRSLGAEVYVHQDPRAQGLPSDLLHEAPELLFLAGEGVEAAELLLELRASGLEVPVLGGTSLDTAQFVQVAGEAATGTVYLSPAPPLTGGAFYEAYQTMWGGTPGPRAALAYDACGLLLDAVARCIELHGKPSREGVVEALAGAEEYLGVTGRTSFDAQGQAVKRPVCLYEIVGVEYPGETVGCPACAP